MAYLNSLLLFVSALIISSFLIDVCRAEDRAPHGLAYASPLAFSPEAYDFFHPNTQGQQSSSKGACSSAPDCSTLPLAAAAAVKSTPAQEESMEHHAEDGGKKRQGGHSLVGIPIGLVFALLVALGAYFVFAARRRNAACTKPAQLQAGSLV